MCRCEIHCLPDYNLTVFVYTVFICIDLYVYIYISSVNLCCLKKVQILHLYWLLFKNDIVMQVISTNVYNFLCVLYMVQCLLLF